MFTKIQATIKSGFILVFLAEITIGQPMMCMQDSCTHPKVAENYDAVWFRDTSPPDGWHMEIGNKVARLHIAELIQGKLLTYDDDFSQMCGRIKYADAEEVTEGIDANYYGYGNRTVDVKCHFSETEKGVLDCDYSSSGLSKYAENKTLNYITYSDNKNVIVVIKCFPNGESGWVSVSRTTTLTEEERKQILDHLKSIGHDTTDIVPLYNDKCPIIA